MFNHNKLPVTSGDKYQSFADEIIHLCGSIENKKILEIGSDWNGEFLQKMKKEYFVSEAYGINIKSPDKKISDGVFHLKKDAGDTGFEANTFDFIYSLAAFEHINNLSDVLEESYRILKNGGILYTVFGPIWSSAWGHHLWLTVDDKVYTYKNTFLPSFCHLLSNQDELIEYLVSNHTIPEKHCQKIAEFVFNSNDQNRLFYDDYMKIYSESKFKTLLFLGHKNFPLPEGYCNENYIQNLKKLNLCYPEKQGQFGYNSITSVLYKNE